MQWGHGSVLLHPCFGIIVEEEPELPSPYGEWFHRNGFATQQTQAHGTGQGGLGTCLFCTLTFLLQPGMDGSRKVKVFVAQSCPTLCYSTDCVPPGSSAHRILQARILEWEILQGIFLTQGLNLGLPHRRQILYHLRMESQVCEINAWAWPICASLPMILSTFSRRFFWCGPFLKSLLNLLQCCFCLCFGCFGLEACRILAPRPGIKPASSALEGNVLTTGPPEKSLLFFWLPW